MPKLLVLDSVEPPIVRLVAGIANTAAMMPAGCPDIVVTHGYDGTHKIGSLHKLYAALDIRTHNLTDPQKDSLFVGLRFRFPLPRFDVLFEDRNGVNEHIHVEDNSAMSDKTGAVKA